MNKIEELKEATQDYVKDPKILEVFNHPLVSGHYYYDVPGAGSQEPLVTPQVALFTTTLDIELETLVQQLEPYITSLISYMLKTGHSLYENEVRVYLDANFVVTGESYYLAYENGGTWNICRTIDESYFDMFQKPMTLLEAFQMARMKNLTKDKVH